MTNIKPKREIAISTLGQSGFSFYSTSDAASELTPYGLVEKTMMVPNLYFFKIDKRYDLADVVSFVENYGEPK